MMTKIIISVLVVAVALMSCKQGNNPMAIDAINQSLQHSNELIQQYSDRSYGKLKDKAGKTETKAKASIWFPKAAKAKELAATINQYIDSLQKQLAAFKPADYNKAKQLIDKEGYTLFDKLVKYRESLLQIVDIQEFSENPSFQAVLKADLKGLRKTLTSYLEIVSDTAFFPRESNNAWVNNYLRNNTVLQTKALLTALKSDVLLAASMMIDYYENQVGMVDGSSFYSMFQAITLINSNQFKAGQSAEITAGEGHFTNPENLQIRAGNYDMQPTSDYVFVYKFIARGKPGTYQIPVTMKYDKPDGSTATFTKQVEYTIVP